MTEENTARSLKPVETKKVADEVHEQEFQRILDTFEISTDGLDAEDEAAFRNRKATVIAAMKRGRLIVNDDGIPVFTPKWSEDTSPITFHPPTGAAFMAMDQKKAGQDVSKTYRMWAEAFKQAPHRFPGMDNRDLKVVSALVSLFLG